MSKLSGEHIVRISAPRVFRRGAFNAYKSSAGSDITCNKFNMHLYSRSLLGLGALSLASCGTPAELDESIFPPPNETGYADGPPGSPGGSGSGLGGQAPVAQGGRASTGGGGSGNASQGGTMQVGTGGAMNLGGNASSMGGGSMGGGSPGGGGGQATNGGGSGSACPDDITELFKRPGTAGGCDGSSCHIPGGIQPDLVSPGVEARLVDVASSANCAGRPYISSDESLIADKISGPPPCGGAMPFLSPQALSAADEQCILDWVEELSGG